MKIDNKSLLVLALLGGGAYYFWKKRKPVLVEAEEPSSGGGGGGGGGIFPIIVPPAPAPAPTPAPTPVWKDKGNGGSTVSCGSGYIYDFVKKACVPAVIDKPVSSGTTAKPPSGTPMPYDPCAAYGGVYDAATNSCLRSPYCGGGTLKLDSNGKAAGCSIQTSTGTGTVVIGGGGITHGSNSPAGPIGGPVLIPFSGKMPLTLDNLLH